MAKAKEVSHEVVASFTYTEDPRAPSTLSQVMREHWIELMPDYPDYIRMGKSAYAALFYAGDGEGEYRAPGRTVQVEYDADMPDDLVEFVRT